MGSALRPALTLAERAKVYRALIAVLPDHDPTFDPYRFGASLSIPPDMREGHRPSTTTENDER